jgi:glycolate dehydrogenase FAD-binding subunit
VHDLLNDVVMSSVVPTAIEIDLPVTHIPLVPRRDNDGPRGPGTIAVLLEGTHDGVAIRSSIMQKLLGGDASTGEVPPPWWGRYPFGPDDVALKLAVPVADLHAAIYTLRDAAGVAVPVRGSAGVGVVHAALPGTISPDEVTAVLTAVRGVLVGRGGSCVVLAAPARIRGKLDLWGVVPGMNIMRRVKEQFDPFRLLSPGRFVGGL